MRLIDADALDLDREVELADDWKTAHEIANCVKYAPTVDAVPVKHGRWEYIPGDGKFRALLICGRCRRSFGEYIRFNYCPNCGAKMDLEEQDAKDET